MSDQQTLWTDGAGKGRDRDQFGERLPTVRSLQGEILIEPCRCPIIGTHVHTLWAICATCGYYVTVDEGSHAMPQHNTHGSNSVAMSSKLPRCIGSGSVVEPVLNVAFYFRGE
jgi:hypothetical protein